MNTRRVHLAQSHRDFISGASAELRDPITMCRGYLELLGDDPDERNRALGLVLNELDRMARVIDGLELFADSEQPDFLRPEPIDLELFTHELVARASAIEPREWKLDAAAQGTLVADQRRLSDAVMHLARNAVQHTFARETVAIGSALDKTEARLWVRDTGVGVPAAEHERIFDRFARGRDAHLRYRGGGLGLSIVKLVAEAHGGRVELESRVDSGSTFTIVLPWDLGA
jgi:signal transduction histidine kinase